MTCLGGAIVGAFLLYVGSLDSAPLGAPIMATFSAGVAVPFLLAAALLSYAKKALPMVARFQRYIAGASLIVGAFGFVVITDNFHVFSDLLYPLLYLPRPRLGAAR